MDDAHSPMREFQQADLGIDGKGPQAGIVGYFVRFTKKMATDTLSAVWWSTRAPTTRTWG